jgi:hypothetical protein
MKTLEIPNLESFSKRIDISKLSKNDDGTYDYNGDLDFSKMKLKSLTEIPIKFKNINGTFDCSRNQLVSLEVAPKEVHGYFNCSVNQLVTLEGAPEIIQGSFYCYNNQLVTLEGGPIEVKGTFNCHFNQLVSLEGVPDTIQGNFLCYQNNLISDKHLSKVYGIFDSDPNPFKKTKEHVKIISEMSYDIRMKQLNFLGNVDIKGYNIFLEILEELGVNVSLRKELSNISKSSGLDDIGF